MSRTATVFGKKRTHVTMSDSPIVDPRSIEETPVTPMQPKTKRYLKKPEAGRPPTEDMPVNQKIVDHVRNLMGKQMTSCCWVGLEVAHGEEGTSNYVCEGCKQPVDPDGTNPKKRIPINTKAYRHLIYDFASWMGARDLNIGEGNRGILHELLESYADYKCGQIRGQLSSMSKKVQSMSGQISSLQSKLGQQKA